MSHLQTLKAEESPLKTQHSKNYYISKKKFKLHLNEGQSQHKDRMKHYFEEGLKNKKILSMVDHSISIKPELDLEIFDFRLYEEYK